MMKYSISIQKRFHRDIEEVVGHKCCKSFAMETIEHIIKDLEANNYDTSEYSKKDIETISKFLYYKWDEYFERYKVRLEERRKQGLFI